MRYNETKKYILETLEESDMDAQSIYEILNEFTDISIKAVQMALLRYYRWGLLDRTRDDGIYNYEITDKGIERLNWLREVQG
jgi:DNA-binding transcriptional ArsR family regulator